MSRNVISSAALFLGVAMFCLVGLRLAASSSACCGSADPSSPAMMAAEPGGLPAPAKSDQELIAKQKTCPVTDQALGSMGQPVKVTVKGRTVFLCCAGCKARLLKNADKYLAKLDKQSKK